MDSSKTLTLSQLLGKYKTLKHARTAYVEAGKCLVDLKYLSWGYIKDIVTGRKHLIDEQIIVAFKLPPRLFHKIKTCKC